MTRITPGSLSKTFAEPAQQYVLSDGLAAVEGATLRASQLTARLREVTVGWSQEPLVKALQAMRGVEFVTAVTLVAEVGDFRRFAKAADFMGYVGLIPSEQTSGNHRRQGPITKTGNAHVRHVLVESAWHYRRQPRMSKALRERSAGISPQVCAIAWKAQKRLHDRSIDGREPSVTAVAGTGGFRMGDQPGVFMLSVRRLAIWILRPICAWANPEGWKRAASCRPPSVLAPSWLHGRPPPGPRIIVERGEAVRRGSSSAQAVRKLEGKTGKNA